MTIDIAKLAVVHDGQCYERQGHAKKIEEERRSVQKCVFDEDKGRTPYDDDRQQEKVGDGGGAESIGQLVLHSRGRGGVDGFAVDYGAEDFGVEELLRCRRGDVAVEDDEIGEISGFQAA